MLMKDAPLIALIIVTLYLLGGALAAQKAVHKPLQDAQLKAMTLAEVKASKADVQQSITELDRLAAPGASRSGSAVAPVSDRRALVLQYAKLDKEEQLREGAIPKPVKERPDIKIDSDIPSHVLDFIQFREQVLGDENAYLTSLEAMTYEDMQNARDVWRREHEAQFIRLAELRKQVASVERASRTDEAKEADPEKIRFRDSRGNLIDQLKAAEPHEREALLKRWEASEGFDEAETSNPTNEE